MSNCKGCNLLIRDIQPFCLLYNIIESLEGCPCLLCIVKAACTSMCEKRNEHFIQTKRKYPNIITKNLCFRNGFQEHKEYITIVKNITNDLYKIRRSKNV